MQEDKLLNLIGILLSAIGTFLMWKFTPPSFRGALIGATDTVKEDIKNQKIVRLGVLILGIGFLFQLIALLIS